MANLSYNGSSFEQRDSDGMVNLTAMAQTHGKQIGDWTRQSSSKAYVAAVASTTGIPVVETLITIQGGDPAQRGTWGHPLVAIAVAQWLSPEFHVWCNIHIKRLVETGSTSIPQQPKLPSDQVAVRVASAVAQIEETLSHQPRLMQFLIDHAISDIMPAGKTLGGSRLRGVVEIAIDLGYKVSEKNRSQLGKFVKAACSHLLQEEERLCNGTMRLVACYPEDAPEVAEAIHRFFA